MSDLPKLIRRPARSWRSIARMCLISSSPWGNYDLVAIVDAPDNIAAAKVSDKIAAQGNFRAETLAAVTMEEFMEGRTEEVDLK